MFVLNPDAILLNQYGHVADQVVTPSRRFEKILKIAIEEAKNADVDAPSRHGAVLFSGSRVISTGRNSNRFVSWTQHFGVFYRSMHAELACLHGVSDEQIRGSDLLVCRINKAGEARLSKPCRKCLAIMATKGVRKCYYTTGEGENLGLIRI